MRWIRAGLVSGLAALVLTAPLAGEAQQLAKVYRIGYLSGRSGIESREEIFRQALRELGYVEGQNIAIEWRFAEGKVDRLPELAADLVRLRVDVIVVPGATATKAVKNVTLATPIVMTNVTDPVGLGLVASLTRPGGNITGLTNLTPELGGKRLELLKEVVPRLSRIAVVADPTLPTYRPQLGEIKAGALALGLQLQSVDVRGPDDLENAFSAIATGGAGALIVLGGPTLTVLRKEIVERAAKSRLPAMYPVPEYVDAGGLMSYAMNDLDLHRRAASYVHKILKGAKPADLPVEQPTKFDLIINLKAAKALGLIIPQSLLLRADRVIE